MEVIGTVREWHDEDGWGLIDSAATPGGCWAHFSAIHMRGYHMLTASEQVRFTFEEADQDGYRFRALDVWLPGLDTPAQRNEVESEPSSALRSSLRLDFDDGTDT